MSSLGSSIFDLGTGSLPAIGTPVKPKPGEDCIASGPGRLTPNVPQMLGKDFDDVSANFGIRTYEAMLTDPAVYSSYWALKFSILAGEIQVQPRIKPKGYRYSPPNSRTSRPDDAPARELSDGETKSQEVAEFCERELARLKSPVKSTCLQMLDCMAYGNKLAEVTRDVAASGPDAGRLVLKALKVKPEWAWQYVVNAFMDVVGVITYVPAATIAAKTAGFVILPPEKFATMAWLPRDNDPRGTSALRAAYTWWNLKCQVQPFYYAHLRRFGSPSLDGVLAPNDTAPSPKIDPTTGKEIPNTSRSSAQRFVDQLIAFQNNAVIVRPNGSELNVIEPNSKGEAFLNAFDLFDRQICLAIGLQVRASLEAKHGSKADSDTAENTRGLIIDYGRELVSDWLEKQVLYESVKANFGEDVANEHMPYVVISDTEAQDFAANLTAAAGAGYTIGPSQLEELDAKLGMPERDAEADQAAADEAMQKQAELVAKTKPPGGEQGGGGRPSGGNKAAAGKPPTKGGRQLARGQSDGGSKTG